MSLEVVKAIKVQYLDKRQWDKPETLKPYDLALKRAVEDCIKSDGQPPEAPKPVLPAGPVADLYARLEGFAIDPEGEFLGKMIAMKKLPATCTKFLSITAKEAEAFLNDWEGTIEAFEADFNW